MASQDQHDVSVKGRKSIEMTGVSSVDSFDTREFSLTTSAGPLHIQGANLHMKHFDLQAGVVVIEGTISSLAYAEQSAGKKRIVGRLFR